MSVLAGAVATLFKMRENENSKAIAELKQEVAVTKAASEKCEQDRHELFTACELNKFEIKVLKEQIARMDNDGTKFSHSLDVKKGQA